MKTLIIKIIIFTLMAVSMIYGGYITYNRFFNKPIELPPDTTQVAKTPRQVKKVKKVKQPVNIQLYDKTELDKKYKLVLKPSEGVGAIGEKKTETGKTYITSVIDVETGENKILTTDVRDKFRLLFDPSIGAEVKAIGSYNTDMARIYSRINFIRINGNLDIYVKGEVTARKDMKYQTNYGVYGGIEWHFLK